MARLNEDGQWIIMMAFIICVALFFLALVINESTLVGQTTAEGVLEFSKSDIQDLRSEIVRIRDVGYSHGLYDDSNKNDVMKDIEMIGVQRKNSVIKYTIDPNLVTNIHFNNGVTLYDERLP
jgi:hypothetical protein